MKDTPRDTTQSPVPPPTPSAADGPVTTAPLPAGWPRLLAWLPIPLLLALIAGLWVADLRTVYESRTIMVLLNLFFTWLASACICFLTARAFLGSGQPGLLMFGCGSLVWGFTSLAAAGIVDRVNPTITVHNLGVLAAALCHLLGLLWRGRLPRPGRWLTVGYVGSLMVAALIFWGATAGLTPVFFVQDHGGTPIREIVLLLSTVLFACVAWQMISRFRRQFGAFYYWYGLGLALVATGLIGVMLLSVQGGILGWTNRLTQYLGSAYLFIAALMAARETGTWTFSLSAVDDALQKYWFIAEYRWRQPMQRVLRYGAAVAAVAAGVGLRLALEARFGPGLPPYITFYPAIMVVALLAGFGPCLVAMVLSALVVGSWVVSSVGQFAVSSPADRLGLVIFSSMGLLMGVVTELHRRYRHKAAAYDREAALSESREALRESRAKLEAAFASMTEAIFIADAQGRLIEFNEEFVRYHRFKDREECSRTIADCSRYLEAYFQDGTPSLPEMWAMPRALRGETASDVEYMLRRKDTGETWWGSYSFAPIEDENGRIVGAVVAGREITERKRTEEQIQRHAREVAQANEELSRFNRAMVGRELRMIELKKEINDLSATAGQPPRYRLDGDDDIREVPHDNR